MFVQVGLRFLEQAGTSGIGGFERRLTEMAFELLPSVIDATFDLIELVKACVEGEQDVKGADGGIAVFGRSHFALEGGGECGRGSGHERFQGWRMKIKEG